MARTETASDLHPQARPAAAALPARQAYQLLRWGFVVLPIVAGADKFLKLLTEWHQYLAPVFARWFGAEGFMYAVGAIEIAAGIGVALKPRIFAYVVAAWLAGIVFNLLLIPGYYDVALRDVGLIVAALALGRLSEDHAPR